MKRVIQIQQGDTVIGMWSGFLGGLLCYILQFQASFWGNLLQAGLTALVCGAAGVAGKEIYSKVKKAITNRKHEKTVRQNRKN